jgi:hypothetical protein
MWYSMASGLYYPGCENPEDYWSHVIELIEWLLKEVSGAASPHSDSSLELIGLK